MLRKFVQPLRWSFIFLLFFRDGVFLQDAYAEGPKDSKKLSRSHSILEKLEGPESQYTGYLLKLIQSWPTQNQNLPKTIPGNEKNPVQLQCIETPGNSDYIGIQQFMVVNAAIQKVEAILDDINHYQDIFPDFDDIHIISRDENKILTYWEQHIPLFFVPNVKYQVHYLWDKSSADRKMYRYQLKESKSLKKSDGLIVIERDSSASVSAPRTRYFEYDFYDADWGILKTIAPDRIWTESVEGVYRSDVAIKLKAENPSWDAKRIVEESKKLLEAFPVKNAIESKVEFKN